MPPVTPTKPHESDGTVRQHESDVELAEFIKQRTNPEP